MKCNECKYYDEGKCRKNPPLTIPIPGDRTRIVGQNQIGLNIISYWPQVNGGTDFCGEFRTHETETLALATESVKT